MTLAVWFWILMVIWLVGYGWAYKVTPTPWPQVGLSAIPFILFLVLGWKVFGSPVT